MDIQYEGYVEKYVGVFKNKSKILMVLGDASLAFFKDQKAESCIGSIDLTEITDVKSKDDSSFVVITSSKTYTFTPCKKANVVDWISAIQKSVNRDTQTQQNSTKSVFEEIDTVLPETQSNIFGVMLKSTRLSRSSSDSDSRNSLQEGDAKRSNIDANYAHNDSPVQVELSEEEQDRKAEGKATEVASTRALSECLNTDVNNTAECNITAYSPVESKQTAHSIMREFNTTVIEIETNIKITAMSPTGKASQHESMEEIYTSDSINYEVPVNCRKHITQHIRDNANRSVCQTFEIINDQTTNNNSEIVLMNGNKVDISSEWMCSASSLTDQSEAAEAHDGRVNTKHENDNMEKLNCSPAVETETTLSERQSVQSSPNQPSKSVSVISTLKSSQSDDNYISKVKMRRSSSGRQSGLNESNELKISNAKLQENNLTEGVDISEVVMRKSSRTSRTKNYIAEQARGASSEQQHISDTTSTVCTSADDEESKPEEETKQDEVFLVDDVFANMSDKEESVVQMPVSRSAGVYSEAFDKLKAYLLEHRNGFDHDVDCPVYGAVDRLRQYFKVRQ